MLWSLNENDKSSKYAGIKNEKPEKNVLHFANMAIIYWIQIVNSKIVKVIKIDKWNKASSVSSGHTHLFLPPPPKHSLTHWLARSLKHTRYEGGCGLGFS